MSESSYPVGFFNIIRRFQGYNYDVIFFPFSFFFFFFCNSVKILFLISEMLSILKKKNYEIKKNNIFSGFCTGRVRVANLDYHVFMTRPFFFSVYKCEANF